MSCELCFINFRDFDLASGIVSHGGHGLVVEPDKQGWLLSQGWLALPFSQSCEREDKGECLGLTTGLVRAETAPFLG